MYAPRLVFYPASITDQLSDYQSIQSALFNIDLIEAQANSKNEFLLTEKSLNLLTFLGCAPDIHLSPEDGERYCYVKFMPISEQTQCLGFVQSFKPSCSACKQKLNPWLTTINWQQGHTQISCPNCQHTKALHDFKYRREAAYGYCGFYIANIHPHEVLPNDSLLDALQSASGYKWAYAYANNQEIL